MNDMNNYNDSMDKIMDKLSKGPVNRDGKPAQQAESPTVMHLKWSPVTQGYMLLFGRDATSASIVERYETQGEAIVDLRYKGLVVDHKGRVRLAKAGE